ncbi:hypothetical protein XELAEV_18042280mg [Xenopus laevis]|uniref:Uncharacterized protein n=1 Tax=Xenopus laevis TaxID=8355 RepID=A0A974C401_XENLA|nr:hypothetical protein XELAEV_18042280mg [Xenopus laevis]
MRFHLKGNRSLAIYLISSAAVDFYSILLGYVNGGPPTKRMQPGRRQDHVVVTSDFSFSRLYIHVCNSIGLVS